MTEIECAVKAERERCANEIWELAILSLLSDDRRRASTCLAIYAKLLGMDEGQASRIADKAFDEASERAKNLLDEYFRATRH